MEELRKELLNMEGVISYYNSVMYDISAGYSTINTSQADHTDKWNLRDMVAECDYFLNNCEDEDLKTCDIIKLQLFIDCLSPFIKDLKCTIQHYSEYDN